VQETLVAIELVVIEVGWEKVCHAIDR
jgi:hypothetical protein